ncbi:type IV secretory system conjugative DNA transfer family protein [Parasphingorhabdus flavimaris]|uniref:Type IV secretory system conjugative DNA transfer family protein n=1 Tax=Parasphingorhabdus flavimaris TaxID=266812 RepID=A0ABX2N2T7_9SPHN|nr:type IV secretory system conjugative DNA transfer family protein [Parasphingorhabdus flavimaris]NVD28019.1 type IV secretory system conjugative DNA transfer family protein [Parasphingorhabdus flavimaris]|tara:strand:- start:880 stop:2715 length:1836 start_codon:yes stop_codon:yes gene_type:complete
MTQKAGTPPDGGAFRLLIGIPFGLLIALAIASMIGWLILGLPVKAYDPLKIPQFVWYYRGDPQVVRAMAGGLIGGGLLLIGLIYALWARGAPLHGAARFARESEIKRHGFRARSGIVLGRKGGRFLTFGGSEHVIVEAPTRSGKGTGIVIPNLLTWQGSVVVLDVKRENYDASAGFRAHYGQDVYLFNPTDREGRTARYNPLAYINRDDPDDVIIELQKIATMLFVAPDHGEAFWANGARTGFAGVGAWLADTSDEPLTMGAIYRHLTEGDARSFFRKELADPKLNLSVGCRTALADFAGGSDNSFADVKKTITNVLGLWLNPLVDSATAASDFDLRDLRKRPMSIYLGVSPDELDRIAPLYNLLLQQLIDLNVRELPGETTPIPVLVILDEFARLGRASVIASAFSYVAGYGIRLLPVIQSRSQLRGVYGEHVADEIVANCGVEVAFTPKELRVANDLSERIGYVGQESVTKSLTINGLLANRSKSMSEQRRALMLPQELMQFSAEKLILLRGGIPPIIGTKIAYFSSRFFKKRAMAPPVVPAIERRAPNAASPASFREMSDEEAEGNPAYPLNPKDIRTEDYPSALADLLTIDREGKVQGILEEGDEHG